MGSPSTASCRPIGKHSASRTPHWLTLYYARYIDVCVRVRRYRVSEQAGGAPGAVSSLLNVSVSAADGGRYTCRAHNALGAVEHSARLDVYGRSQSTMLRYMHSYY